MKRKMALLAVLVFVLSFASSTALRAGDEYGAGESIIVATGADVPIDESLPEEYRMPEEYTQNAVQFRTEDGVLLCGYVLGQGNKGITLAHANGWMVKSWLPFGLRLVDAGYMVILWEFRNIAPSGFAPEAESQRWDLDVLAAAQVLRERGVTQILCMGASDGGNATAVAAPFVHGLVGLALLSSPANSKGNGPQALAQIDVPAFFAVSTDDPGGNFYPEVETLYNACASPQKEFHVLTSYEHGTDLLSDEDVYSRMKGSTEEQKQERRQLADDLMHFTDDTFSGGAGTGASSAPGVPVFAGEPASPVASAPVASLSAGGEAPTNGGTSESAPKDDVSSKNGDVATPALWFVLGAATLAGVLLLLVLLVRRKGKNTK